MDKWFGEKDQGSFQWKGAKYTRGRLPVKLVYFEKFHDKKLAMKREYAIKQLSREEKLRLIKDGNEN